MNRLERRQRLAEARTWAGYRHASFTRQTGTLVVTVDALEQGLESDLSAGRWANICDAHDTCILHDTLEDALAHGTDPAGWCEDCRDLLAQRAG
jgi:hypothetical protein